MRTAYGIAGALNFGGASPSRCTLASSTPSTNSIQLYSYKFCAIQCLYSAHPVPAVLGSLATLNRNSKPQAICLAAPTKHRNLKAIRSLVPRWDNPNSKSLRSSPTRTNRTLSPKAIRSLAVARSINLNSTMRLAHRHSQAPRLDSPLLGIRILSKYSNRTHAHSGSPEVSSRVKNPSKTRCSR